MGLTIFRVSSRYALVALCVGVFLLVPGIARGQSVRDAVKYGEAIVCLNREGKFVAWDAASGEFKPDLSTELSKVKLERIGSNGKRIWGVQEKKLLEWSPETKTWAEVAKFDAGGEELSGIAVVGETSLLIFPSNVVSPVDKGKFEVPRELRVLAVQPMDDVLWIGTGHGEWGGQLFALDVHTGKWVQFRDSLHYVTGIARGPKDEPIVSWSMSHFGANTLIRVHKPDATPEISYPQLEDRYYQKVTYSPFDKKLYGVEGKTVVAITEGKPETVAKLDVQVFEREPKAIGVAPGIIALIPVAPETLVVVPSRSASLMIKAGKLIPLRVH